jgi:Protein of unknown function (DUF4089)
LTDTVPVMYLDSIVEIRVSETAVEQLAALVGLPISPSDLPGVAVALGVLLTVAQLVTDFPLPDDVEAAPVFHP